MIWERTSPSKQLLLLENFTNTTVNGNSMRSAVDSRAVWQHSADIMESKLHKFFYNRNNVTR